MPQILHKLLFLNSPGSIAFSQEHFKTISYAKFGGQTECIMGNSKIVNILRVFDFLINIFVIKYIFPSEDSKIGYLCNEVIFVC